MKLKENFEDTEQHCGGLLKEINQCLFVNLEEGQMRLLPSYYDRNPFKKILQPDHKKENSEELSYQNLAKKFFSIKIQEEATRRKVRI